MPTSFDELAAAASEARNNAYAPYSQFKVGAAVLSQDGRTFAGVNVENSSYGLTICAERVAAAAAVTAGVRELAAIAIATDGGHAPCGACRQFLNDFQNGSESTLVILVDSTGAKPPEQMTLASLLPRSFRLEADS